MLKVLSSVGLSRCYGELRHYVLERVKIEPALVYEVWTSSDYDVHARSIEGTTIEDGHLLFFANGVMVSYDEFCVWYYTNTKSELEQVLDALDGVLKRIDELESSLVKNEVKAPATKRTLSSETIVSLYNEGVSVKDIAVRAGIKPPAVYSIIRRYGDK